MYTETVVHRRKDRDLHKTIIKPGDYAIVPYEDSRCKIKITEVNCMNKNGDKCEIEPESVIFSSSFEGNVLIGSSDSFIDIDMELILQQMCSGETCRARLTYRDNDGVVVKEISCVIELLEVTEEQLISDWSAPRLLEVASSHKEQGVRLVKENRLPDAFRRFSKALKFLVAIEPVDVENTEINLEEAVELKVKLFSNLAHIQLHYKEFSAACDLCDRALQLDPDNIKALYRRCLARSGLELYEEAWDDIQHVLRLDPDDKSAKKKANELRPIIEKINKNYSNVIKKMFAA